MSKTSEPGVVFTLLYLFFLIVAFSPLALCLFVVFKQEVTWQQWTASLIGAIVAFFLLSAMNKALKEDQ